MSLKYVCQSCLRAARQSRLSVVRAVPARSASSTIPAGSKQPSSTLPSSKQSVAPSLSAEGIQNLTQEIDKQSHLANESTDPPNPIHNEEDLSLSQRAALRFREQFSSTTETYVAYGATERLYAQCAAQANYTVPQASDADTPTPQTQYGEDIGVGLAVGDGGAPSWWYGTLGLTPTFSTWAQVTFLHMYALAARMRRFPREHVGAWGQHLTDHFFHDAEARMDRLHGISAAGIRNRYLKDLFVQYRGVTTAYDEGLVRGDAVLAGAVWRNLYKAAGVESSNKGEMSRDVGEVDWVGVAQIVSYLRRTIARLDGMSDGEFTSAKAIFDNPEEDRTGVLMGHAGLQQPFVEGS